MARILATYSIHPDSTPYGVCWCVLGYLKANILYIEITLSLMWCLSSEVKTEVVECLAQGHTIITDDC